MKQIQSLISYTDWLMFIRGEICPMIGDKYFDTNTDEFQLWNEDDIEGWKYVNNDEAYFATYYVEVPYPVIEWKGEYATLSIDKYNRIKGFINSNPLFVIINTVGESDWNLNNYASNNCKLFNGSLEECKNFANKLLYGNI